jgi:predicted DNA-binding transcriptional regulator AlpA
MSSLVSTSGPRKQFQWTHVTDRQTQTGQSLRPQQLAASLGISKSTLYQWLATREDMPKMRRLSARCVVGDRDEFMAWRDAH